MTFNTELLAFAPSSVDHRPSDAATPPTAHAVSTRPPPTANDPAWEGRFNRWITLNEMTYSMRYRSVFDITARTSSTRARSAASSTAASNSTSRASTRSHFMPHRASTSTGRTPTSRAVATSRHLCSRRRKRPPAEIVKFGRAASFDHANYIASQSSDGWSFYVRQLYFDAEPIKGVELSYGSMGFDRGVATEMTTYDNDGYIAGERISITRPKNFYFDEASVTYAYLGDLFDPNFFTRGERLGHADYHQFLLRKHFTKRIDTSFDYTWQNAANNLHEDALFNLAGSHVLDSFRVEFYQRLNGIYYPNVPHIPTFHRTGGHGFGFTASKKIDRLLLEGGIVNIDEQAGVMTQVGILGVTGLYINGDQYGMGNRYFIRPSFRITPYLELATYYTHLYGTQTDPTQVVWNKQALQLGFVFNMKKALFKDSAAQ